MLIAQITDMHVVPAGLLLQDRVDSAGHLAEAVAYLNRLEPRPDVVMATGDLVDEPLPESYANLAELLAPLEIPLYLIPGNHDARAPLRAAFPGHAYLADAEPFIQYTVEDFAVRLVALDTLWDGHEGGHLCEQRLAWLDQRLAEQTHRPTVLVMHHPPFRTGLDFMDRHVFRGADALRNRLHQHPHVVHILSGHIHRAIHMRFAGAAVAIAPSTAYQIGLSLGPASQFQMAADVAGLALYQWLDGTGLVAHVVKRSEYAIPSD